MTIPAADSMQLNLVTLPWDVRDLIYTKLLEEDYDVPESPAVIKKTWCLFPFWLSNSSYIHVPPPARSICQGLLGCCRQVRQEVTRRLEGERRRNRLRCKLDCMALRNGELFASWLWLPSPTYYLDILEVYLRVIPADAEIEGAVVPPPPDRFLTDPVFKMSELIEEFFYRGPSYRPVKVLRTDIEVKELIINIVPPPSVPDDVLQGTKARTSGRLPDGSFHPEKIFQSLSGNYLLQRILRGRMKELIVRYDGRVYRWNSAEEVPWGPISRKPNKVTKPGKRRGTSSGARGRR